MYETPKPDEKKLLGRSIAFFKDPRDTGSKKSIVKIYRNGKLICAVAGHPQFAEAKKEEKMRLKQQQKQATLDSKNQETRKFRYKLPSKRKLDFNDDKEEYMTIQSTTSSQPAIPTLKEAEFKVDPNITFHAEPEHAGQGSKGGKIGFHMIYDYAEDILDSYKDMGFGSE
ncbi:hypothetical protein AgCh_025597 [Apium graveolens]